MELRAFDPMGPTINVDSAATAPDGIVTAGGDANQYLIYNASSVLSFVAFGVDAATAKANAVVPTGGGASSKNAYPAPPGAYFVLTAPKLTYWSAISASGAEIYITPGRGT